MLQFFTESRVPEHGEGELYKVIDLYGSRFPIYYGYYEELDRNNPTVEPMPVYPDFVAKPRFTSEGYRFVTKMQDTCRHYIGDDTEDKGCADCSHYCHGADLLGICKCEQQRAAI